jgi:hypothetical protein
MNVSVIGSTHPGYVIPIEEALKFSGHEAGICYMKEDFKTILNEPIEDTMRRVRGTVMSGHHSVADHVWFNLLFEGIPKIIAMILNNEKMYTTSEKSARYTHMKASPEEDATYNKWIHIFEEEIKKEYPQCKWPKMGDLLAEKLAQENARYFISVFTPATTMGYTVSLRQGNYLIGFCESLMEDCDKSPDPFMKLLRPWIVELHDALYNIMNVDGLRDNRGRKFSLFATRRRRESNDENYCINYSGSFAEMAQAQRHRTLWYEMLVPNPDNSEIFVPPIIRGNDALVSAYLSDMEPLKYNYPQGMLIDINERGPVEAFCWKCHERLCGAAQLEICMQTEESLQNLISGEIEADYPDVYAYLMGYDGRTKCTLGHACNEKRSCPLGPQNAFTRLI